RLQMNHSIHSADRATHLKIVAVALVAGIAVAAFGIVARTNVDYSQTAQVIKAGKPVAITSSGTSAVRQFDHQRFHKNGRLRAAFFLSSKGGGMTLSRSCNGASGATRTRGP